MNNCQKISVVTHLLQTSCYARNSRSNCLLVIGFSVFDTLQKFGFFILCLQNFLIYWFLLCDVNSMDSPSSLINANHISKFCRLRCDRSESYLEMHRDSVAAQYSNPGYELERFAELTTQKIKTAVSLPIIRK